MAKSIPVAWILLVFFNCTDPVVNFDFESQLTGIFKGLRPTEGRLSNFSFGEYLPNQVVELVEKHKVLLEKQELQYVLASIKDISLKRNLSLLYLWQGRYQEAADNLMSLLSKSPENISIKNDLAVIYLEAGTTDPKYLLMALQILDGCVKGNHPSEEVLFNYALVLQKLALNSMAMPAWDLFFQISNHGDWESISQHYLLQLTAEPDIAWAKEIFTAKRLTEDPNVIKRAAFEDSEQLREYALNQELSGWMDTFLQKGVENAKTQAESLQMVGKMLYEADGDNLVFEIAENIEHMEVSLIRDFQAGRKAYHSRNYKDAESHFSRAFDNSKGQPIHTFVGYQLALAYFQNEKNDACADILNQLSLQLKQTSYFFLQSQVETLFAMLHMLAGEFYQGLPLFSLAMESALRTNAKKQQITILRNRGSLLENLGERKLAMDDYLHALALSSQGSPDDRDHLVFGRLAYALLQRDQYRLAEYFFKEMVSIPKFNGLAASHARALRWLAWITYKLGDERSAREHLNSAKKLLPDIPNEKTRIGVQIDLTLMEGRLMLANVPGTALQNFNEVFKYHQASGSKLLLPEILLWISKAHKAKGDEQEARRHLIEGVELVEDLRANVDEDPLRISYFDTAPGFYEELIQLLIEEGEFWQAFMFSEQFRSRFFNEKVAQRNQASGINVPSFSLSENFRFVENLPQDVVIFSYQLTDEYLFVWKITKGGAEQVRLPCNVAQLKVLLEKLSPAMAESAFSVELGTLLRKISQLIVAPLIAKEDQNIRTLLFVPDKELWSIPFGALIVKERFLIQDHLVAILPSVTHYFQANIQTKLDIPKNFLGVGNPYFSRLLYRNKSNLPGAEREVEAINNYPDKVLLLRRQATPSQFLEAAKVADVIHIACHTEIDARYPLSSRMFFAESKNDPGILRASDLYEHKFDTVQCVVLAGCEAGGGSSSKSERGGDLARPFLAGGVRAVIASLREVDDEGNIAFSKILHQNLAQGESPGMALQKTYRMLLKGREQQDYVGQTWPFYQVYGLP